MDKFQEFNAWKESKQGLEAAELLTHLQVQAHNEKNRGFSPANMEFNETSDHSSFAHFDNNQTFNNNYFKIPVHNDWFFNQNSALPTTNSEDLTFNLQHDSHISAESQLPFEENWLPHIIGSNGYFNSSVAQNSVAGSFLNHLPNETNLQFLKRCSSDGKLVSKRRSSEDSPLQTNPKKRASICASSSLNLIKEEKIKKEDKPKKPRSKQHTSEYRGVSKCSKDGRWQARIRIGKEVKYLGRFKNEVEAAVCYDKAAREYHKEKAVYNFPNFGGEGANLVSEEGFC